MPSRRTTLVGGVLASLAGRTAVESPRPTDEGAIAVVSADGQPASLQIANEMVARLGRSDNRLYAKSSGGVLDSVACLIDHDLVAASILPSTALAAMERMGASKQVGHAIRLIGRLDVMAVQVLASRRIGELRQLAGEHVNLGPRGSVTQITASLLLDLASLRVDPLYLDHEQALPAVLHGQVPAMILVAPKPSGLFFGVKQSDNVHLLPMVMPGGAPGGVFPTQILPEDYPILAAGEARMGWPIDTVGVPLVLGSYAWAPNLGEYLAMARLADRLAGRGSGLPGFDMAAEVPGWQRFWPVAEWLAQDRAGTIEEHAAAQQRTFMPKRKPVAPNAMTSDRAPNGPRSNRVPNDATSDRAPHGTASAPVPHGTTSDRVPHGTASDPVPHGTTSDRVPNGTGLNRVPHDTTSGGAMDAGQRERLFQEFLNWRRSL
ncbi:MAG: TAXI family TRAP transporter solute-binding subunit [Rhodopila sp.]|nr:TAXI family TRAP transporter solute-binding subunit [Rhodopila sp.]